jgi:hypothetical protein
MIGRSGPACEVNRWRGKNFRSERTLVDIMLLGALDRDEVGHGRLKSPIGGSIIGEGSLTIEVKGTGKYSFLSQVVDLVKQAQ